MKEDCLFKEPVFGNNERENSIQYKTSNDYFLELASFAKLSSDEFNSKSLQDVVDIMKEDSTLRNKYSNMLMVHKAHHKMIQDYTRFYIERLQEQSDEEIMHYLNSDSGQELKEMINNQCGTLHDFIYVDTMIGYGNEKDIKHIMDTTYEETFNKPISHFIKSEFVFGHLKLTNKRKLYL